MKRGSEKAEGGGRKEGKRSKDTQEQGEQGKGKKGKNEQIIEKKGGIKVTVCECECVYV